MSDFDASVIYGIVAKPKLIEKLKSSGLVSKKYKSKLKRKRFFTSSPWISDSQTEFWISPMQNRYVEIGYLNVIILSI